MPNKNTLLFTLEYPPFHGGVANYYKNIIKHWPNKNQIFVLHNNNNKLINSKLPVLKWFPAFISLWQNIKKNKINHILVGHILPLGTVTFLISKLLKINYSVILHGMDFSFAIKTKHKKILTNLILKNSKSIICVNSYTAKLVKDFLGIKYKNKIIVVNPGINKLRITNYELLRNELLINELDNNYSLSNKIVLLTVGRLVKRKGIDKVLESLRDLLKKIPNLVYVILGSGPELKNIKKQISKLNLEKNIIIITDADEKQKNAWYKLSDIFIMTSRNINGDYEGFGIVYLEANLHKTPVIAGNSGGVKDAVIDNLNGLLVDPENINEIKNVIIKLAQDEFLRKKLGNQGYERAINEFKWKKQIESICSKIYCV